MFTIKVIDTIVPTGSTTPDTIEKGFMARRYFHFEKENKFVFYNENGEEALVFLEECNDEDLLKNRTIYVMNIQGKNVARFTSN